MRVAPTACVCSFIPPHVYRHLSKSADPNDQEAAHRGLALSERVRGQRDILSLFPSMSLAPGQLRRTIYDADHQTALPGKVVRTENGAASTDNDVESAYAGAGFVYKFYKDVYKRDSLDNRGTRLDSSVHYDENFGNALWNGSEMVYGDGDDTLHNFTTSIDVIAHEMTHGVTSAASGLVYQGQSGALNEHISDVFGVLALHYDMKQNPGKYKPVAAADRWIIGSAVLILPDPLPAGTVGRGIRDMLNPGTAYAGLAIGDDPQPAHMKDYNTDPFDSFGVHINSGIPNKAFATYAVAVGGDSWDVAGRVWYRAATNGGLSAKAQFTDFKQNTIDAATIVAPDTLDTLKGAWADVGL